MICSYTTMQGVRLSLDRIPRIEIDDFIAANPEPKPPTVTRTVTVWGEDEPQEVTKELKDDPEYIKECEEYYLELFDAQVGVISPAVEILDKPPEYEIDALYVTGIPERDRHADTLRYIVLVDSRDAVSVTKLVLYNSTVTAQGIEEARKQFAIKWRKRDAHKVSAPTLPLEYSMLFESMRAARYGNVSWENFCKLTGPQQSALVAFMQGENKLQWLINNNP